MKKSLSVFLLLVLLLSLAGCHREESIKQSIFDFVEKNEDLILLACIPADPDALLALGKIKEVDVLDGYILAYCESQGIAPSTQDYGFYYSQDDLPVAIFDGQILCDTDDLKKEGNGYRYIKDGNVFYTEKIVDNLWFYSSAF